MIAAGYHLLDLLVVIPFVKFPTMVALMMEEEEVVILVV